MGLIRGVARTAVVAGTATAVSNRVSRRQAARWAQQDEPAYQQVPYQQAYSAPPPVAPTAAMDESEVIAQLKKWGDLKAQGLITEEEFAAQKARLLGS